MKECLSNTREILKKNSLRVVLSLSLATNGAVIFDAGVRDGETVKDISHAIGNFLEEAYSFPCDDPIYYEENQESCDNQRLNIEW